MKTPHLNHALVLEAPVRISDSAGGFTQGWMAQGTLWAEITARTGREAGQTGAPVSRMSHRIVVRGAPWGNPDRPAPHQRFRDGTRIFNILAVAERDPNARYLVCFAEEEVAI